MQQQIKEFSGKEQFKYQDKLNKYNKLIEDMRREVNKFQVDNGYK